MKINPFLLFFLFFCGTILSQRKISIVGTIVNENQRPIPDIDIFLKNNNVTSTILAFSVTNELGQYKFDYIASGDTLFIETSSLQYQSQLKKIPIKKENTFIINFQLRERIEELEEVEIIASPKITVRNDTTVFNLNMILNGRERVVEEILQKLPGVEIDDRGRIKYKNKDVVNVLLDGDNLFNGNYTVGTKRINASHIKGVEAIENFERNSLLQGLSENDQVALNIKFGDGVSLSGDSEMAYANGNRISLNTTAITISKSVKGFGIVSFNSIGNKISNSNFDATDFIDRLLEQHSNGLDSPSYIGNNNNLFPTNNSISNREVFGSLNFLPKLSKTETLRINLNGLSDKSLERNTSLTLIGNNTDSLLRIFERNTDLVKPSYFNTSLFYEKYTSASTSWSTNFNFSKLNNERQLLGIRNDLEQRENTVLKDIFLSNNSLFTHKINDKSALSMEAVMAFSEKPETLKLFSGINLENYSSIPETNNQQSVNSKKQQLRILNSYYHKIGEFDKLNLNLNFTYLNNSLLSKLFDPYENIAFENNLDYKVVLPELMIDYLYKHSKLTLRPILISKLYSFNYINQTYSTASKGSEFLLDAGFHLKFDINKRHSLLATINHKNEIPDEKKLYDNFILSSNRILQDNEISFENSTNNRIGLNYNYENLTKDINANFGFAYKKEQNVHLPYNLANDLILVIRNRVQNNVTENRVWNLNFSQYFSPLRSTIRFKGIYGNSNYTNFLNESSLRLNKMKTVEALLSIGTSFIGKFLFGNNLNYSKNIFFTQGTSGFTNEALTNKLNISYVPNNNFRIESSIDYYVPNLNNGENNSWTLNSSLQYINKKKNFTYTLEGRNLFNQSQIGNIKNTDFSTTITSESVFDRLVIVRINFRY